MIIACSDLAPGKSDRLLERTGPGRPRASRRFYNRVALRQALRNSSSLACGRRSLGRQHCRGSAAARRSRVGNARPDLSRLATPTDEKQRERSARPLLSAHAGTALLRAPVGRNGGVSTPRLHDAPAISTVNSRFSGSARVSENFTPRLLSHEWFGLRCRM